LLPLTNINPKVAKIINEKLATNFVGSDRYLVNTMSWVAGV